MNYIGIDIGSTTAKTAVLSEDGTLLFRKVIPTGWSGKEASQNLKELLDANGFSPDECPCVATGYGRVSVPYAKRQVTEITCHARGAMWLHEFSEGTIIDIGGQDTKIIQVAGGTVQNFLMNDKCSAGTGRFLEVMARALETDTAGLCELSAKGGGVTISSMCTVFAETEIISLVGRGEKRENIAYAVLDSIADKVAAQAKKMRIGEGFLCLTGGLCECEELKASLADKLGQEVVSHPDGRFAGAIGAALSGMKRRR